MFGKEMLEENVLGEVNPVVSLVMQQGAGAPGAPGASRFVLYHTFYDLIFTDHRVLGFNLPDDFRNFDLDANLAINGLKGYLEGVTVVSASTGTISGDRIKQANSYYAYNKVGKIELHRSKTTTNSLLPNLNSRINKAGLARLLITSGIFLKAEFEFPDAISDKVVGIINQTPLRSKLKIF